MQPKTGGIKLVDFGLARIFETPTDADLTFPGAFVGSPSYASPEQAAGRGAMDGRSDLYSLAVTWFTLIAGQPPFIEDEPSEVLRHHLSRPFPDLRELTDVPTTLLAVMAKASEKRPDDRYASAAEMVEAVEKLLAEPFVAAPSRAAPARLRNSHPTIAEKSVTDLESQLQLARSKADSSTQLAALRGLYGLYTQLDRREDAAKVFREALVLHVEMQTPSPPHHRR